MLDKPAQANVAFIHQCTYSFDFAAGAVTKNSFYQFFTYPEPLEVIMDNNALYDTDFAERNADIKFMREVKTHNLATCFGDKA